MEKKTVWMSAFINVVPADYENWLENMALEGWEIKKIGQWSSVCMTFEKGESKKYRYVYDMQTIAREDYKATYEQFGWEFVGQMASAFIWRKEYDEVRPESFTDLDSLEKRSKRVMAAASVSAVMFFLIAITISVLFIINFHRVGVGDLMQFILGLLLTYNITLYMAYVLYKINRNRQR